MKYFVDKILCSCYRLYVRKQYQKSNGARMYVVEGYGGRQKEGENAIFQNDSIKTGYIYSERSEKSKPYKNIVF